MSGNMPLIGWWKARGKSDARDGKPFNFELNDRQHYTYTDQEKYDAHAAYATGYQMGLPEEETMPAMTFGNLFNS